MRCLGRYLRISDTIDPERNDEVQALARALVRHAPSGVSDVVPSYGSVYVEVDADRMRSADVDRWIASCRDDDAGSDGRDVELPVRYGGPDLAELAEAAGMSEREAIALHAEPTYRVYALGFLPGFPFLGEVAPPLRRPRRPRPRSLVPVHSVAVAGPQTGVYALPSPGGWNLIGTALEALYDPSRDPPFLLEPGDRVRFVPRDGRPPAEPAALELLPPQPARPTFAVRSPGMLDLVVDAGRFRAGRLGLARAGAIDARSAALANRLVANPAGTPLLELNVRGPELEVLSDAVVAFAGGGVRPERDGDPLPPFTTVRVRAGEMLRFPPSDRGVRGYLALAGGVESRRFFGSASVDVRARVGRPLAAGDVLGRAAASRARPGFAFHPYRPVPSASQTWRIRAVPGPQASDDALAALTSGSYAVRAGDRLGMQLEGPDLPGGELLSEATPLGAIQVTTGGHPIVLLHDRGSIGGYAKPAIVVPDDLAKLAQARPGQRLRFVVDRRARAMA